MAPGFWRDEMGEAKRRGTFEERKAQAIAEGRIKREANGAWLKRDGLPMLDGIDPMGLLLAMGMAFKLRSRGKLI